MPLTVGNKTFIGCVLALAGLGAAMFFMMRREANRIRDDVLHAVRGLRIPIIDISSTWETIPQPLSLYALNGIGHYNAEGYRNVGVTILRFLRQHEGLIIWSER